MQGADRWDLERTNRKIRHNKNLKVDEKPKKEVKGR